MADKSIGEIEKDMLKQNDELFKIADEILANGYDTYAYVASKIFNKPYAECKEKNEDGSSNPVGAMLRTIAKYICIGAMSVWEIEQKYDGIGNFETMICDAFPFKDPDDISYYAKLTSTCQSNTYAETCCTNASVTFLVKMTAYVEFMRMQKRNMDKKEQLCL